MTCMAVPTAPVAEAGTRQPPAPLTFLTESEAPSTEAVCFRPTKLFIGGISRNTTTKHLRDHFSKFGKVLDCVAMRLADGRPRGFGYVTLDSPAAAERCLREPQLLDNRIVDMKAAVPEGSSASTSPKDMDRGINSFAGYGFAEWPDASPYGAATPWWTDGQFQNAAGRYGQMPDCLDLLNGAHMGKQPSGAMSSPLFQALADMATHDPFDGTGLVLPPHMKMTLDDTQLQAGKTLSASAPEFVPRATAAPEGAGSRRSTPKSAATGTTPKSKAQNNGQNRSALGEITNINIAEVDDLLKPFKSPTKNSEVGQGQLSFPKNDKQSDSPFPIFEDAEDDVGPTEDRASTTDVREDGETIGEEKKDGSSKAAPEAEVETDAADVDLDSLPSIGSALHSKGECKRCNFFSKGRCQNGKDCAYCHFPHEKTKPTRQEKRERRTEWLEQQAMCQQSENLADQKAMRSRQPLLGAYTTLTQMHSDATSQSTFLNQTAPSGIPQDGELYSDETLAYSIFPGLPPIRATKLPAPLALPGAMDMQGHTRPALPPGLVAPSWQREAEVDPALDAMLVGTMGQHAFSQVVASTYASAPLSTAPSLAATPTALLSTTPTPTHTAPTSPTAVLSTTPTGASTVGLLPTEDTASSWATQTNEADMCTQCEKSDAARAAEGCRWSRDELLQLRGAVAEKSKSAPLFNTKAISAL